MNQELIRKHEELESVIKNTLDSINKKAENINHIQDQVDSLELEIKKGKEGFGYGRNNSFEKELTKSLGNSESFKQFKDREIRDVTVNLKAADITQANNLTGQVIAPTRVPGVYAKPDRSEHIRDLIPSGRTDSNSVYFTEESSIESNADTVAEGGEKPQSDLDLEQKAAPVKKIATHLRVSEETLTDIGYLSQYIGQRFGEKVRLVEDSQLLYGNGTGNNLTGLTVNATSYTDDLNDSLNSFWDVLMNAVKQNRVDEYRTTGIIMHPDDLFKLEMTKDANGRFLSDSLFQSGTPMIKGIPIIETTAINSNSLILGDFRNACGIFQREGLSVRFFDQDQDNAIKNMITVVIEERFAFPIYRPDAFIHISDIDASITAAQEA